MSRKKSRLADARAAKDARMKKIAIGGAVLLVAVLAFEIPKMMKHGSHSASPPPATTTTPGTATTPTTTPPVGATPDVLPTASMKLPDTDLAPKRSKSELFSFSHFAGKDPFVQQVQDPTLGLPNGGTADLSSGSSAPPVGLSSSVKTPQSSSVRTLAASGAVKIQVNGRIQTVRVGGSFPSANPLFRLISIGRSGVKIGIANGSYASGAHTVALTPGRTLTLVDTADGIHYKIRLLSA